MSGSTKHIFIICQSQQIEHRIIEWRLQKFCKEKIHHPKTPASLKFKFKVINFGYNNLFILIKMLKEYYFSSPTIFEKKMIKDLYWLFKTNNPKIY